MDELHAKNKMGALHKTVPPDCFTLQGYSQRYGVSRSAAGERLQKMIESGEIEIAGRTSQNMKFFRFK